MAKGRAKGHYPHVALADFGFPGQLTTEEAESGEADLTYRYESFFLGAMIFQLVHSVCIDNIYFLREYVAHLKHMKPRASSHDTDPTTSPEMRLFIVEATRNPESSVDPNMVPLTSVKLYEKVASIAPGLITERFKDLPDAVMRLDG